MSGELVAGLMVAVVAMRLLPEVSAGELDEDGFEAGLGGDDVDTPWPPEARTTAETMPSSGLARTRTPGVGELDRGDAGHGADGVGEAGVPSGGRCGGR